ncbi:AtpZ/AtpI family protein [Ideonella sp. B508-1]|uniref:AtpZ/AtpI family protein n=1 Tax=Ideonella sp. B508-1 TaxID=137716 RepID=UPI00034A6B93|nr:AtpZ/AtpI family protein [Ideonella sp. B508-1]
MSDEPNEVSTDPMRRNAERQLGRLARARKAGFLGLLVTGGTAGLLLCVPLVGGAYLGRWLDSLSAGYSVRWTVNLILLGLAVGVGNVIWFFRSHGR